DDEERRGDLSRRAEEGHGAWGRRARRHQRDDAAREPQVLARNRHESGRDRADRAHHPEGARAASPEPPGRADRAYAEPTGSPSLAAIVVGETEGGTKGTRPSCLPAVCPARHGVGSVAQSTMSAVTLVEDPPKATVPPPDILLLSSSTMAAWPIFVPPMVNVTPRELPASPSGNPRSSP